MESADGSLLLNIKSSQGKKSTDELTVKNELKPSSTNAPGLKPDMIAIAATKPVISSLFTANLNATVPEPIKKLAKSKTNYSPSNGIQSDAPTFESLGLLPVICGHLQNKLQMESPTRIQQLAIPAILNATGSGGSSDDDKPDVVVHAQTGSGKTLAYLLPILNRLIEQSSDGHRETGTHAIVLCPTRELAFQVSQCVDKLLSLRYDGNRWICGGSLTGGEKRKSEKARLRKGVTILVATPGRLLDHLKSTQSFRLDALRWLILDEADRYDEMGFRTAMQEILQLLSDKRDQMIFGRLQMILCSATVGADQQQIAGHALCLPIFVSAQQSAARQKGKAAAIPSESASKQQTESIPNQLKQQFMVVPPKLRLVSLAYTLNATNCAAAAAISKTIVFFSNCDSVEFHYSLLTGTQLPLDNDDYSSSSTVAVKAKRKSPASGTGGKRCLCEMFAERVPVFKLHGSIDHRQRLQTYSEFLAAESAILLTTDVAARGLDLPKVTHIFQYDVPLDIPSYLHRMGRTARLGGQGEGLLWLMPSEVPYLDLLAAEGVTSAEKSVEQLLAQGKRKQSPDYREEATRWQRAFEEFVIQSPENEQRAKRAYMSSIRAYATHQKHVRKAMNVHSVHLGHLAKAFGLRTAPSTIKYTSDRRKAQVKRRNQVDDNQQRMKQQRIVSEFAAN